MMSDGQLNLVQTLTYMPAFSTLQGHFSTVMAVIKRRIRDDQQGGRELNEKI